MERFRARNREQEIVSGVFRLGVPTYSERAFREGIANALTHRDYARLGAVHVQWKDDEVEISNPGGFPEGVHLGNLLVTAPRPRNPLLADAFKRAGVVERTGRGIDTIFTEQIRNGRPPPSYEQSSMTDVILSLPGGEANLAFVRVIAEEARTSGALRLSDLLILNHLRGRRVAVLLDARQQPAAGRRVEPLEIAKRAVRESERGPQKPSSRSTSSSECVRPASESLRASSSIRRPASFNSSSSSSAAST